MSCYPTDIITKNDCLTILRRKILVEIDTHRISFSVKMEGVLNCRALKANVSNPIFKIIADRKDGKVTFARKLPYVRKRLLNLREKLKFAESVKIVR